MIGSVSSSRFLLPLILSGAFVTSCTVDEPAALLIGGVRPGAALKDTKAKGAEVTFEEKKEAAAKAKLAAAEAKQQAAREAAEAKAEAKERAEKLALAKKKESEKREAEEAEAKRKAAEEAAEIAEKKARAEALLAREQAKEAEKAAKLLAKAKADADRAARDANHEIELLASRGQAAGFFARFLSGSSARQYKSEGHEIFVNHALLPALDPSNATIEVDLSDQRARVYREHAGHKLLVIETQISSGKSGHATPTGSFKIGEKLEQKQSTLYGTWVDGGGNPVGGSTEVGRRPSGASRFVGADMPYWMRINGGIGLHVGIVPDQPASHGCIRVPASIQPLIFSKVEVGTPVTVTH